MSKNMAQIEAGDTLVYTRCVFFRGEDTTLLERQVNYFLSYAPLAELKKMETTSLGEAVLITLWFDPMPSADNIDAVYAAAIQIAKP